MTDPVGAVEVGEHVDVKQLGSGGRAEGVQPPVAAPEVATRGLEEAPGPRTAACADGVTGNVYDDRVEVVEALPRIRAVLVDPRPG